MVILSYRLFHNSLPKSSERVRIYSQYIYLQELKNKQIVKIQEVKNRQKNTVF